MDTDDDMPLRKVDIANQLLLTKMRLRKQKLENEQLKARINKMKANADMALQLGVFLGLLVGWLLIKLIKSTI